MIKTQLITHIGRTKGPRITDWDLFAPSIRHYLWRIMESAHAVCTRPFHCLSQTLEPGLAVSTRPFHHLSHTLEPGPALCTRPIQTTYAAPTLTIG